MNFKNLLFCILVFVFTSNIVGCATLQPGTNDTLSFLALENTTPLDTMPDGRQIYYVALEADFKCLVRTTKGLSYQRTGKYDETLFICLAQDRQDGMWDVVRFRYPNGQRERTTYRYNSEKSAFEALLPVIYK